MQTVIYFFAVVGISWSLDISPGNEKGMVIKLSSAVLFNVA